MTVKPRYSIQFYLNQAEYERLKLLDGQGWKQKELFLDGLEHKITLTQKAKNLVKDSNGKN